MIGLALEGGGAKGAYQAGAYMAMKKCGIKVNAVAGTSIGSFNGALIASHDEDKMIKLWKDATMSELLGIDDTKAREILASGVTFKKLKTSFTEIYKVFKSRGLDMSNYRALVRNSVDEEKLRKSNISFGLTTVRVETLSPLEKFIDEIQDGKVHDYIVASSFLPVFKKEKLIDDGYYLDGGFYNLSPVDMLEKIGCDQIYVINIRGLGIRKPHFKKKAEIIEIKPKNNLGSMIIFDKATTEANIKRGYLDTLRVLKKIDGINYYFNKRSKWYYKRLNHNVDPKLYKAASALLGGTSIQDTTIKALEYVLKKEKKSDLVRYKHFEVINLSKNKFGENIIYKYVGKLGIW